MGKYNDWRGHVQRLMTVEERVIQYFVSCGLQVDSEGVAVARRVLNSVTQPSERIAKCEFVEQTRLDQIKLRVTQDPSMKAYVSGSLLLDGVFVEFPQHENQGQIFVFEKEERPEGTKLEAEVSSACMSTDLTDPPPTPETVKNDASGWFYVAKHGAIEIARGLDYDSVLEVVFAREIPEDQVEIDFCGPARPPRGPVTDRTVDAAWALKAWARRHSDPELKPYVGKFVGIYLQNVQASGDSRDQVLAAVMAKFDVTRQRVIVDYWD